MFRPKPSVFRVPVKILIPLQVVSYVCHCAPHSEQCLLHISSSHNWASSLSQECAQLIQSWGNPSRAEHQPSYGCFYSLRQPPPLREADHRPIRGDLESWVSCFSQQEKSGPYGRKYDDSIVTMPSTGPVHTCQTTGSHSPEANVLTLCFEVTAATPHEQAIVDALGWSRPPPAAGGVYARQCLLLVASSSPGNEDPTLDLLSRNVYLNKCSKTWACFKIGGILEEPTEAPATESARIVLRRWENIPG